MTERDGDSYLWDRSGEPDATVRQLEQLLAGLGHDDRELELPAPRSGRILRGWPWLLALAAGIAVAAIVFWPDDALQQGAPARTFVASDDPVVIRLGELAAITLAPGSELHFAHWQKDHVLLRLARGAMTAQVAPWPAVAPDWFQVDTPLGRVIDKGCKYELSIENDGTNVVRVSEGAVTFEFPARTVFVPAGAGTRVTSQGPSTPLFEDCSAELRDAVQLFDGMAGPAREKSAYAITQACTQPRDSLVLWHLLRDDDEALRLQAEDALLDLVGLPADQMTKGPPHWEPEVWLAFLRLEHWM